MVDWDRNSPQLEANLTAVLRQARDTFRARGLPTLDLMRVWHRGIMNGLTPDDPNYVGQFRGEAGVAVDVHVDGHLGTPHARVHIELLQFEKRLQQAIAHLDLMIQPDVIPTSDQEREVLELTTWAHFEWVRIHPFANGNGRTARLWTNAIAMRYNMPPFLRLRPRPDEPYGRNAAEAMKGGKWKDLIEVFAAIYDQRLSERG